MKTFLNNLRKELKKRQFSKEDIDEIIADHKEMIETAREDGVSDDELHAKFGDPEQLADDLLSSKPTSLHKGGQPVEGYTLFKTFPVLDLEFDVLVELISEDVQYIVHDMDQIEVYVKRLKHEEDYIVTFEGNLFTLKRRRSKRSFVGKSPKFIVKVPQGTKSNQFMVKLVSGDATLEGLNAKQLELHSTSGDVELRNYDGETAKLRTVSGDFKLVKGSLGSLKLNMVSGDCELHNTVLKGDLECNTVSGDLKLNQFEAGDLDFKSVSGDLKGEECYPNSVKLRSISGDINIKNENKTREIQILNKQSLSGKVKIK